MADTDRIKRNLNKMLSANAPEADLDAYLKTEGFSSPAEWRSASALPQRTGTEQAARIGGQFAQNTNDAIAGTIGAPVDLAAAGLRKLGINADKPIGGSESIKSGIDYVATLPGRVGDAVSQRSLSPLTEDRTSRFEPENRAEKIAAGVGQGVGAVASTLLPAGVVANAARPGTLTQGVAKALASQPATQLASGAVGGGVTGATDNPWMGLAAGLATPLAVSAGRGLVSPVTNRLGANERALVDAAKREGIELTAAQKTGSPALRGLEETMARVPLASGPMRGKYDAQREALNRAIMSRTGSGAAEAAPGTMTTVGRQLGGQMDDLASRTNLAFDQTFADDVTKVATDYGRRLSTDVAPVFKSYMDDLQPVIDQIAKGGNPQMAGETYKTIRSSLTTRMRNAQSNPDLRAALGQLVKALDDVVDRTAPGPLLKEWQDVRRQYAAYKTVDKAMQGGTQADRAAGNIPLGAFANAVKAGNKGGYSRAQGQYGELAKVADFLAPQIPNSGTPERLMWANLLTGGALAAGGGLSTGSLGAAAAAAATPYLASKAYNSPLIQKYLTNQLAGNTDLKSLFGAEALRRLIESAEEGQGEPTALARALMQANEKRQGAGR